MYFVAVMLKVLLVNLLAALNFAKVFLKIKKNVRKIKKRQKNVKNVTRIKNVKNVFTSMHQSVDPSSVVGV